MRLPLKLNSLEYLETQGLNVMLAHDYYPESHQGGVGIIQHGRRVATNGDVRLEPTPGQWSPVPSVGPRMIDRESDEISVRMVYPDETKNRKGFNPIDYPDLQIAYHLRVSPVPNGFRIVAELESELPADWMGKVGFNLELFPGDLFGKSYRGGDSFGIFPTQPIGPGKMGLDGEYALLPLAKGESLTIAPEDPLQRMTITVIEGGEIVLLDGRGLHNNGWFVLRSLFEGRRIEWLVKPNVVQDWISEPVIQVSQVGYLPHQQKVAVVELDPRDDKRHPLELWRVQENGPTLVKQSLGEEWGKFLRYHYLRFDFSDIAHPGMYFLRYGPHRTAPFAISPDVFSRGVWQPTVDTFLPVQMCHMRVVENYRVWHGACHLDDARMAPVDHNHFDGYLQGPTTLCSFAPGQQIPGLDRGGWHDAGDYDLRIESQCDTIHGLALAYEQFGLDYDNTTIHQDRRLVELHRPDGKPDILQQIEHGVLSVLGGYGTLGRLYRGIIEPTLEQYVHLGDAATQTDNVASSDDRWVFTEDNPARELSAAAALAAAARVLRDLNPSLADDCGEAAAEIYDRAEEREPEHRLLPALELFQTTGDDRYLRAVIALAERIAATPSRLGDLGARAIPLVRDTDFTATIRASLSAYREEIETLGRRTPFGLPYEPDIWGAGWGIQRFGVQQYWLHYGCPDLFSDEYMYKAIDFVLGCHPGPNTVSFVSGVGAKSLIPGYGVNRADGGFIPGGSGSGTALIRPDFPELLRWPFLWQQTEYCLGHPTADYVFLVAAADSLHRQR